MQPEKFNWIGKTLAVCLSVACHLILLLAVFGNGKKLPEPLLQKINVVLVNSPEPAVNIPEPPTPTPQKPEPPTPEPPKPEPPTPEPPKPEPPTPEPLKPPPPKPPPPKPSPPKPPPPKPPPPKPQVITSPPPKPAPPKPAPGPIKSIRERIREAEVKEQSRRRATRAPSRSAPDPTELRRKFITAARSVGSTSPLPPTQATYTAQQLRESNTYAEQIVGPFLYQRWVQPSRAALGSIPVRPVEVSFTVYANGTISNCVIRGENNNPVLVQSLRTLFAGIRQMPPLSAVNSKETSLNIVVIMSLESN